MNDKFKIKDGTLIRYAGEENNVEIPEGVSIIARGAFARCSSIEHLTIPDGVTKIEDGAFSSCCSLSEVRLPETLKFIEKSVFFMCLSLQKISVNKNNKYFSSDDGVLFNCDKTKLICYPNGKSNKEYKIPDGVKCIGEHAFYRSVELETVNLPDSITTIEENAFASCYNFKNLSLPSALTYIGDYAFYLCNSLNNVIIPENVAEIGEYAFSGCDSLERVNIPDSVKKIGDCAFSECSSLTDIEAASDNISFSSEDGVLFNHDKTGLICYPGGKTLIEYSVPDNVRKIENNAFMMCRLEKIIIPDSVISIGDFAFADCEKLAHVELSDNLKFIGKYALAGCPDLKELINLSPETLLGENVFEDSDNIVS